MNKKTVVIVGGGIAGATCAEFIASHSNDIKIILISATDVIKTGIITKKLTRTCDEVSIGETSKEMLENKITNLEIIIGFVKAINADEKYVQLSKTDQIVRYDKLCICTGAQPYSICEDNPFVLTIRDTDTVKQLQKQIATSKKIIIVGNGGIALELVFEIVNCEVVWCIKDDYIGSTFLDKDASEFLLSGLDEKEEVDIGKERKSEQVIFKRRRFEVEREQFLTDGKSSVLGSALGPDWCSRKNLQGKNDFVKRHNVQVEYNCKDIKVLDRLDDDYDKEKYNVYVKLGNGKVIGADLIISATGVKPNISFKMISKEKLILLDNYILVDDNMRTNLKDIYAAGDICHPKWELAPNWFQMKLWTQALQFGAFAGKCIAEHFNESVLALDFCFELFTHATTFFGYKVIVLGCFNCQKLNESDCEILLRYTKNEEYIKLVIMNGRVQGAILIGETDLEETIENLILNQLDISFLGESLLDPDVDIEDYFD